MTASAVSGEQAAKSCQSQPGACRTPAPSGWMIFNWSAISRLTAVQTLRFPGSHIRYGGKL